MFTLQVGQNEYQLYAVKGRISDQSEEAQERIKECISRMDNLIREYGEEGLLALNYIVAYIATEEEKIAAG